MPEVEISKWKKYLPVIITAIVVGGAAFFGGMQYAKSQVPMRTGFGNFVGGGAAVGTAGGRRTGMNVAGASSGAVIGQILSRDAQSITVQTQGNGSKIVFLSTSTAVMKTAAGSSEDLVNGAQVVISGTANSDGSITAQSIQLRPEGAAFPRGPQQGPQ